MITRVRGTVGLLLLFGVGLAAPGYAVAGPDATFYELTENMSLRAVQGDKQRVATSELMGSAKVGTPLCPQELVDQVSPGATFCTLNATGHDTISLATGKGKFGGTFTIVVQGDNPVDGPEFVIARGRFRGRMDFSPAILNMIPLGSVVGKLTLGNGNTGEGDGDDDGDGVPFTGIFRLPFVQALVSDADLPGCLARLHPESCVTPPLYLKDDFSVEPVLQSERALDFPTVRFEITF